MMLMVFLELSRQASSIVGAWAICSCVCGLRRVAISGIIRSFGLCDASRRQNFFRF